MKYGFGSGSSSLVSGYFDSQREIEARFAAWLQVDNAILFNSGYLANIGVIGALANRNTTIFSDKLCHTSLLDGIQLSRAKHYRYRHCDSTHLRQLASTHKPDLIITESLFSMEGNIAPIKEIVTLAHQQQSGLIIDDAHGIGVLGEKGGGICELAQLNQSAFSCLIAPLGKAFNGMGAIVAGNDEVIATPPHYHRPSVLDYKPHWISSSKNSGDATNSTASSSFLFVMPMRENSHSPPPN